MTTIPLNVEPRAILVTRTEVEKTGTGAKGPWTLYRVFATETDGTPITEVLKTFDPLGVGPVTVTQKAFVKNEVIEHYTISDVNRTRRNGGTGEASRVAALEARVTLLERKLNAFIAAFPELES